MTSTAARPAAPVEPLTRYQKIVVALLAFLHFTIVLDFMIISPLGAVLMQELGITPTRFGLAVSAYALSAGVSGLLAAGFADRFDRKRLLLFFYAGFVAGTLMCGLAPSYELLLVARMVTGLFGGIIGAVSLAIIADLFPLSARGRVMGVVQTAFGASQVLGIPLGLYLSNRWGWHAPFLMIVAVSAAVGVVMALVLRPINGHLAIGRGHNPVEHLVRTVTRRRYLIAYAATTVLVTGGFMLMPFSSAFTVHNLGISLDDLPIVYMVTGVTALIVGPLLGRLSDSIGRYRLFFAGSLVTAAVVLFYTRLGATPLLGVVGVNVLLFVGINARMISWSALTSAVPEPTDRGAYMSVSASIQQLAGGAASTIAGLLVTQTASGQIQHYERLGYVVTAAITVALGLVKLIEHRVGA